MKNYRQQQLEDLISCAKVITRPPGRQMSLDRGSWRNDMELRAEHGDERFEVFLRRAEALPENFSIGLVWCPREDPERVCLIRCNGPHGDFTGDIPAPVPHFSHHIHLATEAAIAAGEKPERSASPTDRFGSFEEAIAFFIDRCNIAGYWKHFPQARLLPLYDKLGDHK